MTTLELIKLDHQLSRIFAHLEDVFMRAFRKGVPQTVVESIQDAQHEIRDIRLALNSTLTCADWAAIETEADESKFGFFSASDEQPPGGVGAPADAGSN